MIQEIEVNINYVDDNGVIYIDAYPKDESEGFVIGYIFVNSVYYTNPEYRYHPEVRKAIEIFFAKKKSLDELLDDIQIFEDPDDDILPDWYRVVNTDGIIAYFGHEKDACRFRLDYINNLMNR